MDCHLAASSRAVQGSGCSQRWCDQDSDVDTQADTCDNEQSELLRADSSDTFQSDCLTDDDQNTCPPPIRSADAPVADTRNWQNMQQVPVVVPVVFIVLKQMSSGPSCCSEANQASARAQNNAMTNPADRCAHQRSSAGSRRCTVNDPKRSLKEVLEFILKNPFAKHRDVQNFLKDLRVSKNEAEHFLSLDGMEEVKRALKQLKKKGKAGGAAQILSKFLQHLVCCLLRDDRQLLQEKAVAIYCNPNTRYNPPTWNYFYDALFEHLPPNMQRASRMQSSLQRDIA